MTRQCFRLLFLACLTCSANALEWEDAFWQLNVGSGWHVPQNDEPYPSALGISVAPVRIVPVFVEGHVRLSLVGRYTLHAPKPEAEVGQRGALIHTFSGQSMVLRRMGKADEPTWLGLGLGLSARYLVGQYEWQYDGVQWSFSEASDEWVTGLDVLFRIEKPLGAHWSINPMLSMPLVGTHSFQWFLEAGYTF